MQRKYNKQDLALKDLTVQFIMEFDHFLRVVENNKHNTAVKYCLNLKRVLNVATLQGITPQNPFNKYKTVFKDTPQVYLTEAELKKIQGLDLIKPKHVLVRELFIVQCYTGLSYTDMVNLKLKDISKDTNGRKWIIKARQKSGIICTIPLLPEPEKILTKYLIDHDDTLPNYAIQKYNQYLGEIGIQADLPNKLSSHVGRRTFGNIGLSKGLSLNVISKVLGHSNTLITQRIYAITTQKLIAEEMKKWV
jgi:integrase